MQPILLPLLSALIGTIAFQPAFATSIASCESSFTETNKIQYVSLVQRNSHLFDNPSSHEFKFTMYEDRVVIETLGEFAETAEGRKVFPPVVFPIRRAWRLVVNHDHRLVMVLGNEPLILSFENDVQGWQVLNPHHQSR